jgi:pilus assembly protein CpaC
MRVHARPRWQRGRDWGMLARLLAAGGVGLLLAMLAPSAAGEALAAEILGADGRITLEVRKGQVVRLPRPAVTVFVADPEVADVQAQSPSIVYLFGRRAGTTSLYAVDDNDQLLVRTTVTVTHNLSGLRQAIRQLLPESDLTVTTIDGSIVLDGTVESPTDMLELRELSGRFLGPEETLLNRVRVASPTQVHLRVQVAEVSRAVIKQFGINWETLLNTGNFTFAFASGRALNSPGAFPRAPGPSGGTSPGSLFGDFNDGTNNVRAALDALAEEGLINILAQPNLTALSGETASFLAGGEFPVPVATDDNEIKIEFKEFGISLAFTPTVLTSNRISLRVRPEVSELTEKGAITVQGLTIPALATRRAETTVELGSGQSFMIGGLLSTDIQNTVSKFPGLGDLPVLGTLFRSHRFRSNETELVIMVTPYLVRPISDRTQIVRPTDGYKAPSDVERILEGRLHSARLRRGSPGPVGPDGQRLVGPIGFVLE